MWDPDSALMHSPQPSLTPQPQLQLSQYASRAWHMPKYTADLSCETCNRTAALSHVAASIAHISPWAAMDVAIHAPAPAVPAATQPVPATGQLNPHAIMQREGPPEKEHKKEPMQLLEEACRNQSVDWKALRRSLQLERHADMPNVDAAQALVQDTLAWSMLHVPCICRHDSASSNIEPRRTFAPASSYASKLPVLDRMGTAGSLPVHSPCKPLAEFSCPDFLRALSVEGRSAYQEWRGEGSEGGGCHGEEPNLACKAAISSLENPASVDWLEIAPCARNQSLFSGAQAYVESPFENKIPEHIQHNLTSPSAAQPVTPLPHMKSSAQADLKRPSESNASEHTPRTLSYPAATQLGTPRPLKTRSQNLAAEAARLSATLVSRHQSYWDGRMHMGNCPFHAPPPVPHPCTARSKTCSWNLAEEEARLNNIMESRIKKQRSLHARSSKDAKQGHGICSKSCRWNVAEEEACRKSILAQKQKSLDAKVSMKSFKDGKAARPTLAEEEARLRSLLASRIQKQRSMDAKKCTESFQASRSRMRSLPEPRHMRPPRQSRAAASPDLARPPLPRQASGQ